MTLFKKSTLLAALTAAGLFAIAERPVAANTVYYALTSDHCTNGCGGNGHLFGVITLTDIAGGNGVRFTLELADGSLLVDTGFPPGALTPASHSTSTLIPLLWSIRTLHSRRELLRRPLCPCSTLLPQALDLMVSVPSNTH